MKSFMALITNHYIIFIIIALVLIISLIGISAEETYKKLKKDKNIKATKGINLSQDKMD